MMRCACDPHRAPVSAHQVNMMSAAMLASASSVAGTISDLAPGLNDGMRMLEARAAAQKTADGPAGGAAGGQILFVRGSGSEQETAVAEGGRVANPAEIQLDDDDEDEEEEGEAEDEVAQQAVPAQVFGSLAKQGQDQEDAED